MRKEDFDGARVHIVKAKAIFPTYAETHRISALVESTAEDYFKATNEYDAAVQLAPDSSNVRAAERYWR